MEQYRRDNSGLTAHASGSLSRHLHEFAIYKKKKRHVATHDVIVGFDLSRVIANGKVLHFRIILGSAQLYLSINQRLPGCRGTFSEDSVCIAQQGTGGSGLLLLLPPTFPSSFLVRVRTTLLQDYTNPSLIARATLFTTPKQCLCS